MSEGRRVIDYEGCIAFQEKLPLPRVHYPPSLGAFFGFQREVGSPIYFCSCTRKAIKNYIDIRIAFDEINLKNVTPEHPMSSSMADTTSIATETFILDSRYFPIKVVKELISMGVSEDRNIIQNLNFRDNICHECRIVRPKYRCFRDGFWVTEFRQNFDWYIRKKSLEYGIKRMDHKYIRSNCSEKVLNILDTYDVEAKIDRIAKLSERKKEIKERLGWKASTTDEYQKAEEEIEQLNSKLSEPWREIDTLIENKLRTNLDHYKKGERWESETKLYHLVDKEYPDLSIEKHAKPNFLEGLELDIYIPEEDIAIEYQGKQHYEPVEHFGGKEGFEERQKRDEKKKNFCQQHDIELIYFRYDENLSEEKVKKRLDPHIR